MNPFDENDADANRRDLWVDTFKTVVQKTLEPNCDVESAIGRALKAADTALERYTDEFCEPHDPDSDHDPEEDDDE